MAGGKTARFADVVAQGGAPEPPVLWGPVARDAEFQRALKAHLRQQVVIDPDHPPALERPHRPRKHQILRVRLLVIPEADAGTTERAAGRGAAGAGGEGGPRSSAGGAQTAGAGEDATAGWRGVGGDGAGAARVGEGGEGAQGGASGRRV